ncbi:hypothetical protein RUM43_010443 [Polyplax serrata]|uniref:WW domain-containing protein n=1 Tax=Polyplax serrata TaxID=468196 RepID=A0AAN8PLE8_POLSC
MGPSRRKGSVRRPVLDLNTKEGSPSRPTWQNKYQHALPLDNIQENGNAQTPSPQMNNPLSGLLGNYNSDSDNEEQAPKSSKSLDAKVEDFLKEIHPLTTSETSNNTKAASATQQGTGVPTEALYPASITAWQQCYDPNSGYPYYWNTETNEVTWEMPADLKAALTNVAIKQQQEQQQKPKPETQQPKPVAEAKIKVCKYPWQTESDSEDEKIEMITSFGPQSGEESEEEEEKKNKNVKTTKNKSEINSKQPIGPTAPSMDPVKIKSDCVSLALDDTEGLNESSYGTSSLLTHTVQDTGPPGDEDSIPVNKSNISNKRNLLTSHQPVNDIATKTASESLKHSVKGISLTIESSKSNNESKKETEQIGEKLAMKTCTVADDVIAQIEMETPPDYKALEQKQSKEVTDVVPNLLSSPTIKQSGIALIANYGDDSESEDISSCDKSKNSPVVKNSANSLFPISIPQEKEEKPKPLFPCVNTEVPVFSTDIRSKECLQEEADPPTNIYNCNIDQSESVTHKAFKRKKRLEFVTKVCAPSTSRANEMKSSSPEPVVSAPSTQYNMDPTLNEHRGFGFNSVGYKNELGSQRKTYKNSGGIQFIKAETMHPNQAEPKEKEENKIISISTQVDSTMAEPVLDEQIEDSASLLKEKVTFLTGGIKEISPIQCMAIELETLVLAWQQGALTPSYLLRWLNEKCADITSHEKTAAPSGWTCLWDRKNKRYYYRNSSTKAIQWEYPNVEEMVKPKEGEAGGSGDEMDICDTPPHESPVGPEQAIGGNPSTPPPPVITEVTEIRETSSPLRPAPSPPQYSFGSDVDKTTSKPPRKKKRIANEINESNKEKREEQTSLTQHEQVFETVEPAPPLPPMPPPPPPPPDEPPPPLIESPPPLPIVDPDQPLPPGVDEPEYVPYRRISPKHSYKKVDSGYSTEMMMAYGYALPVQQVVSSATQPITMPMQPLEYHTYMHEAVSNAYLVQPATTSHVIQCSAKKPKVSLNSELMSFYSDLAMLETSEASSNSEPQAKTPPPPQEVDIAPPSTTASLPSNPVPTVTSVAPSVNNVKAPETTTSNGVTTKKKKKGKATSGLAMKKKGVSTLVAKWQQVQQEVRRDFSDDDDDITLTK